MSTRCCSRNSCREPAVATLTYVYATSTAVVGPLALVAEPHAYDLCEAHARRLTIPRGWELVRHDGDLAAPVPAHDDLLALADAVRESALPEPAGPGRPPAGRSRPRPRPRPGQGSRGAGRGGHLRAVEPPSSV